ncbi:MAG: leucyl aminopeptidase family protein, partial [Proteobacteria bacterium]|nr:leucyl aminopeptidase family protein [Pseudomonadota bacterium]
MTKRTFAVWRKKQPQLAQRWLKELGFEPVPGRHAVIPASGGKKRAIAGVVVGVGEDDSPWNYAGLPTALRRGTYRIDAALDSAAASRAAIGWGL